MAAVTVEQMLAARDARAAHQRRLARDFGCRMSELGGGTVPSVGPGSDAGISIVSITLVVPGPDKTPDWAETVFDEAMAAATDALGEVVVHVERHDLETGAQGYVVATAAPLEVKQRLVMAEDDHPHGRLFDLDVVVDGAPLTRSDVGAPPRRCLVCDGPAAPCARSRRHDLASLDAAIARVLS